MTWTASHAAGDVQQFVRVETVPQEVLDASAEVRSARRTGGREAFGR